MKRTEDLTRAYLLGALTPEEKDAVENRLFADDDYLAQIEDAEEGLIAEYVRGTLTEDDRTRFEDHFLASPRRRRSTEMTKALMQIASAEKQVASESRKRDSPAAIPWLGRRAFPVAVAASIVAVLSFAGLSGWLALQLNRERQSAQIERQQVERQPQGPGTASRPATHENGPPAAAILSFALAPGITRGENEYPVRVGSDASALRLSLRTDEVLTLHRYSVAVRRESGEEVWRSDAARVGTREAEVLIPGTTMQPGRYLVTLAIPGRTGAAAVIADYAFQVVR